MEPTASNVGPGVVTFCPEDRTGKRCDGLSEGFEQAADVRGDLFVEFVELAAQSAGVQVIGAGKAGHLLPDPVVHAQGLGPHGGGEAGAVAVDRDLGEAAQQGQGGQSHHRDVQHHAPAAGFNDQVVALSAARRGHR